MEIRIIVLLLILTSGLAIAQASDTIIKPIKKEFFPLEVGNKYIYAIKTGFKRPKIIGHDTILVYSKFSEEDYHVFSLNNGKVYYLKGDSVYVINITEYKKYDYNLLYFPTKKSTHYMKNGSCGFKIIETSYLPTYKIGNKIYTNCYKFISGNNCVVVIAFGIGIIKTICNGESRELISIELK